MTIHLNPFQAAEHEPFLWRGDRSNAALLVHGFPGTPAEMRPAAQVLHDAGWTVQGLLLPGFGPQFSKLTHYTQADWAQAVRSALVALQAEYQMVVLVGNSIGAALALEVAAQQPPAGLILFAPFWCSANRWLDRIFPAANLFVRQVRPFRKANFSDLSFTSGIQRILPDVNLEDTEVQSAIRSLSLPLKVLGQVRRAGKLGYQAAPLVKAPTLILQGNQDVVAMPRYTRQLVQRLPKLAGYVEVEDGHELSRAQAEAWPLLAAFMQRFAANLELLREAKS